MTESGASVCPVCGGPKRLAKTLTCSKTCSVRRRSGKWALAVSGPPSTIYAPPTVKGPDRCCERACPFPSAAPGGWCRRHAEMFALPPRTPRLDRSMDLDEATRRDTKRGRVRRPTWNAQAAAAAQWLSGGRLPVWLL